jgi:hypothetical protein
MGRKVTVSLEVTYDFKGELLEDYLEQLGDHRDTKSQRKWFAIDRFIGLSNLDTLLSENIIDRNAKVKVLEKK